MTAKVPDHTAMLPSGASMPLLGFGTWELDGSVAQESVTTALQVGYRHLDTATVYGNERQVGAGLRESLQQLGTDHVDLWLVHWPGGADVVAMWRAFVEAQELGLARDIGVSNFDLQQLDEVTDATGVRPAVNQIEWSPLLFDVDVLAGHRSRGVVAEGYSALRGGTLEHPVIGGIADRLGRTPAQVIVRWHLQHDVVVIPRSSKPERIRENAEVADFELSAEDMAALDALGAP